MAYPTPEPGERIVSLDDVYWLFVTYLGRQPDYATEAAPRVGRSWKSQEVQIRCSQEAANWRASHGAEPDTWCYNKDLTTGETLPGVPVGPVGPVGPVAPPVIPGADLPIIGGIIERLWPPIQETLDKVNAIKDALGARLAQTLAPILETISTAGAKITQELANNITQLIPMALELAAEAADKAADVAAGFIANAATVDDLFGAASERLKQEKDGLWKFITDALGAGFGGGISALLSDIEDTHTANLQPLLDTIQRADTIPAWVKSAVGLRAGVTSPLALIVGTALLLTVAGQFAQALLGPEIEITRQSMNQSRANFALSAPQAAQAAAQSWRSYDALQALALRQGFNDDQFRIMHDLALRMPDPQMVTGAALRGAIDGDTESRVLAHSGYDLESRNIVRAMALQLPGVQDTIRMAVREVFNPAQRAALTLDADYPPDLTGFARAIGLSEQWARNFWAAHWELPGPNQVFEMLHRGMVTLQEVDDYLKAADYAPVWRNRLRDIAYNVFTRVDIRRIHDLMNKDHAWLVAQHKRLGYNDEDSEQLSQFVEALNDDDRGAKRKELTSPLVGRIITGVVGGTLSGEQATAFFGRLGYQQDSIDTFLTEAALIRNQQRTERVANLIGDLYVKNRRTRVEAAEQLRERGFTATEIDERFRAWDLEKELRAPTEREEKERDLTRSDIQAMYRARQLPRIDAENMLIALRYSREETKAILDLDDFKEKQSEDRDRIEVVHRKFVKGTLDRVAAEQQLGAIGLRATQIAASIARWELEINARSADLSVGQVGELYKGHHWDDDKTAAYLQRIGYDEDESRALLALWGSKIEEQRRRDEIAAQRAEDARQREAERIIRAAASKERDLAKTDLLNAGAANVLRWDEVKLELTKRGYSSYEADVLIRTKIAQGGKPRA